MRFRWAKIEVNRHHGRDDGYEIHEKRKEEEFSNQWKIACRGKKFADQQKEDVKGEQNGDGKGHFFPGHRRQVENEHGQEGHEHGGDDQVDGVKKRFPPNYDAVCDVDEPGIAGAFAIMGFAARRGHHVPGAAG